MREGRNERTEKETPAEVEDFTVIHEKKKKKKKISSASTAISSTLRPRVSRRKRAEKPRSRCCYR